MAPTTRSSTHTRIAPPTQQLKFPRRRKTVRSRVSPPTLPKRQSTLTQIEYISSTPHSSVRRREPTNVSSDDDEDDYEEPQSRKRRKTGGGEKSVKARKRDPRQSTMTQLWDVSDPREIKDSDEEMVLAEDDETAGEQDVYHIGSSDEEPESATKHNASRSSSARGHRRQKSQALSVSSDVEKQSTRPTTADSNNPQTPKKITKTCIPSSNTPASMILSVRSIKAKDIDRRSPLKERSVNLNPSKASPTLSTGKLGLGEIQESMPGQENELVSAPTAWTATLAFTPKKTRQPRKLVRTATVQDSEDEDMDLDESPVAVRHQDVIAVKSSSTSAPPQEIESQATAIRRVGHKIKSPAWRRTGIVQDSEESSFGMTVSSPSAKQQVEMPMNDSISQPRDQGDSNMAGFVELEIHESVPEPITTSSQTSHPALETTANELACEEDATPLPNIDSENEDSPEHELDLADANMPGEPPETANAEEVTGPIDMPSDPLEAGIIEIDDDEDDEHAEDEDYYTADGDQSEADYDLYEPQTYDPVQAALERDAARFGKTDTQLNAERQYTQFVPFHEQVDEEEEEDDDDDLNMTTTKPANVGFELEYVPSSQPHERRKNDIDDSGYVSHTERVPSSQPNELPTQSFIYPSTRQPASQFDKVQLRPSQISTVVDTQCSRPNSAGGEDWQPESSSPFPVPPGFELRKRGEGETQISLTDFSLPPPPPLWTSSDAGRD